jgi:hypothetical protein
MKFLDRDASFKDFKYNSIKYNIDMLIKIKREILEHQ